MVNREEPVPLTQFNGSSFNFALGDKVFLKLRNGPGMVKHTIRGKIGGGVVGCENGQGHISLYEVHTQEGIFFAVKERDLKKPT